MLVGDLDTVGYFLWMSDLDHWKSKT